ncbi:MAG TPA: AraC family transcriptional regulator [Ramlibacter sp.]
MQRTSSCSWVNGVLEMFAASGVDVARLVPAAGIDARRLGDPSARFGPDEVSALWQLAVAWSGNPALGLDREIAARHVNYDIVAYAMASCDTLRCGLQALSRYMAVISDAATFELLPEGDDAWLVLGGSGFARPVPRQRYAYGLLSLIVVCQWVTRRSLVPLAVEFKYSAPPEVGRYREVFGCGALHFDRPENRLLVSGVDLAASIPSRNPAMLSLHENVLRERITALGKASTSYRVSAEIVRRLHKGEPRRDEVAASLAMAERTLQRRLHDEDTSFQQLLDDARRELARKYLSEERYALGEIADLLGFVDQSNFQRASRRWFGEPPGQYRRRLLQAACAAADS